MYSLDKNFVRKCKTQIGAKTHIKCSSIQTAGRLIFFTKLFSILKTETSANRCGSRKDKAQNLFFVPECLSCGMNFKGWLAIAKLKPLSLFISILLMLKKALDNVKIEK